MCIRIFFCAMVNESTIFGVRCLALHLQQTYNLVCYILRFCYFVIKISINLNKMIDFSLLKRNYEIGTTFLQLSLPNMTRSLELLLCNFPSLVVLRGYSRCDTSSINRRFVDHHLLTSAQNSLGYLYSFVSMIRLENYVGHGDGSFNGVLPFS